MQTPPDDEHPGDGAVGPASGSMPLGPAPRGAVPTRAVTSLVTLHEDVRAHVADMLHDGPVQALTAVMMGLGLARIDASGDSKAELENLERELGAALGMLRRDMNLLRSPPTSSGMMRDVIEAALAEHSAEPRFVLDVVGDQPPERLQGCIRRIVHEIASALPACDAEPAFERLGSIQVWTSNGVTTIRVAASGVPATVSASMREDVAQLDGAVRTWEACDGRRVIRVSIPHRPGE